MLTLALIALGSAWPLTTKGAAGSLAIVGTIGPPSIELTVSDEPAGNGLRAVAARLECVHCEPHSLYESMLIVHEGYVVVINERGEMDVAAPFERVAAAR